MGRYSGHLVGGVGNNSEASRAGFAAAISVYRPGKRSLDWFKIKFKGSLLRDREIDTPCEFATCDRSRFNVSGNDLLLVELSAQMPLICPVGP
jgi:hypothetical protein